MKCVNCLEETKNPKFCSRSCAASHNNKLNPRRTKEGKCISCNTIISSTRKFCKSCREEKTLAIPSMTLQEFQNRLSVKGKHPSWKNAHIRYYARSWNKEEIKKPCQKCGYKHHVEVCHIKPVSDFPLTATLGEVNSKDNLLFLCPNCHWENDNL